MIFYLNRYSKIFKIALDDIVVEKIFNSRGLSCKDFVKSVINQFDVSEMKWVNDANPTIDYLNPPYHYEGVTKDGSVEVCITSEKQIVLNAKIDLYK